MFLAMPWPISPAPMKPMRSAMLASLLQPVPANPSLLALSPG
jgi:hypothetical protein